MGWRDKMGVEKKKINFNTYMQKVQNIQKVEKKNKNEAFAPFVPFAPNNQKVKPLIDIDDFSPVSNPGKKVQTDLTFCPARCKTTGKCYGMAWFDHKPGKAAPCFEDQCPWKDNLKKWSMEQ
ncbi:MAG: hypothetical protein HOJ48_16325 [Desulfobacula sp.]|jgi:hypothetical protein|nr:hypothetical protein [Desulfobacula sp.]